MHFTGVAPDESLAARTRRVRGSAINPDAAPAPVNMLDWIPEEFLSPSFEPTAIVDPLRTET